MPSCAAQVHAGALGFFVDLDRAAAAGSAGITKPDRGGEQDVQAIVAAIALIVAAPAEAQFLGRGLESNIELIKHDIAIIHRTVDAQVHGKAVGASASWSNSESGNYGTIALIKKYSANGRPCESVGYTLATRKMAVSPEHYMLNSCLLPDGHWRIS